MTCLVLTAAFAGLAGPILADPDDDRDAVEIGRAIQAVDRLLEYRSPAAPTDLDRARAAELRKAAIRAGQTTRLYPWVSGRLKREAELTQSVLRDTSPDPAHAKGIRERIEFLRRLSYEIDAPH